ncbi:MAG: hypothetical protein WC460_01070 [Patescibacteria group bacterium]
MEEKDLKQIKEVVDQSFEDKFGQIWDKNLSPALDVVCERLDKVDQRLNSVESQMVTKSYLDDKLADLEGGVISKLRKEDEKVNRIISLLKKHKVVPSADLEDLDNLQIFPRIQV